MGLVGLILSKLKRKAFIFEVRDVWPDVPIQLGIIENVWMIHLLKWLELRIYAGATHIVVLSEGMKQNLLEKKVPENKITVAENFANRELVRESNEEQPEDTELSRWTDGRFVVVHPGTMGLVNGAGYLVTCAERLQHNEAIRFLLIGEGSEKREIQAQIEAKKLTNIRVLDAKAKKETLQIVSGCQMGTMLVTDEPILQDNSANKFFDFLACGLPIVLNYRGWQKQVLEESGAGKGFAHRDVEGYCAFVEGLATDRDSWHQAHQASQQLAEKYDVNRVADRIWHAITNVRSVPVEALD